MAKKIAESTKGSAQKEDKVAGTADPFASTVEVKAVRKRKTKAAAETSVPVAKAVRTKKAKTIEVDPFEAVAVDASPVKKVVKKAAVAKTKAAKAKKASTDISAEIVAEEPKVEVSPVFKALADIKLPELQRENRARLQMQTPTRLYFYWSVKENPWSMLKKVFGDNMGNYTMVVKLIDRTFGTEKVHQCDAEGNWWFDVEPDRKYRAEIGFYAPGRPYFRILHSNTVETPRRSPSPRAATESTWTVSANKFAEVLDVAGFSRDAFDVAMAGDDMGLAEDASHRAFKTFIGSSDLTLDGVSPEEIRYALLALAAGVALEELRNRVSPALFAILQANSGSVSSGRAMSSLSEHFEIEESEFTEEEFGAAVYGASLVNFPKTLKTRTVSTKKKPVEFAPRYNPVSSHSIGR